MAIIFPNNMNRLKLYLFLNDDTAANLSKTIGYAPGTITCYIKGRAAISRRLAKLISDYTGNQITVEELLQENPKKILEKKS